MPCKALGWSFLKNFVEKLIIKFETRFSVSKMLENTLSCEVDCNMKIYISNVYIVAIEDHECNYFHMLLIGSKHEQIMYVVIYICNNMVFIW